MVQLLHTNSTYYYRLSLVTEMSSTEFPQNINNRARRQATCNKREPHKQQQHYSQLCNVKNEPVVASKFKGFKVSLLLSVYVQLG